MTLAVQTRALCHQFRGGHGVHDLDLHVPVGAIYGFLGPNGAGKTTTIRLLLDLLRPDRGEIRLFGATLSRSRRAPLRLVGALVESPSLYPHLSGRENLEVTRRLLGAPTARIERALRRVDLLDAADRRVREYSLGMRQRLAIALALVSEPRLLVLDEPSNGLDPVGILELRRLLRSLVEEDGLTVFVSSHLLSEVEQIATHVGVLQSGRLRFEGTLEALRARVQPRLIIGCDALLKAHDLLTQAGEDVSWKDTQHLAVNLRGRSEAEINRYLHWHGIAVAHLARETVSLESLFLDMTVKANLDCAA